jgi:adenosylcobyric acid synthase
MSNNSAVCADGAEIGRAQAVQAEACNVEIVADMNPILLKPTGDFGSQVVLNGRVWKNLTAREYYSHFDFLLENVLAGYARLSAGYDVIVIEGAGSVTELNLKARDLVNLGLARRLNAPCILVADIDRGGVFASVAGTFGLLDPDEAPLVRTFLVNRFRGDPALFAAGVKILEEKAGRPCLGVFPYLPDLPLDAEDSLNLDDRPEPLRAADRPMPGAPRVAIVRLPHISNFTDFRLLPFATYVSRPLAETFDAVVLPGTKSTIGDLLWLRATGLEHWLLEQARRGCRVIGVCGGYQMMGTEILDPDEVESPVRGVRGIGLIPAITRLMPHKITRRVIGRTPSGIAFPAYEIHMGVTTFDREMPPFAHLNDGLAEGVRLPGLAGTYLHGALENIQVLEELLGCGLADEGPASRDAQYDRLGAWFGAHVDRDLFDREYLRRAGVGPEMSSGFRGES